MFITGLVCGGWLLSHYYSGWLDSYISNASSAGIADRYAVLKALRAGDTNQAANFLEQQMDGQILLYAGMKSHVSVGAIDRADIRLLKSVRDYRATYPHIGDAGAVDKTVASILSLTNVNVWPDAAAGSKGK